MNHIAGLGRGAGEDEDGLRAAGAAAALELVPGAGKLRAIC